MNFDRKAPCSNCPFRKDIRPFLTQDRAEGIVETLIDLQQNFTCHKTAKSLNPRIKKEQHCAGAMIIMEKIERPNQLMRIFERLGGYDRTKLKMDSPVFDNFEDFIEAQEKR